MSLSTTDGAIWNFCKILKQSKKATENHPLHVFNALVYTETNKAEAHANYLETVFLGNPGLALSSIDDTVGEVLSTLDDFSGEKLPPITIQEVKSLISSKKKKRAPGIDKIIVTHAINVMLELSYFPSAWKRAKAEATILSCSS